MIGALFLVPISIVLNGNTGFSELFKCTYDWSDWTDTARGVVGLKESLESLNAKIKVVTSEIAVILGLASKLVDVLTDSLKQIEYLKPEIQQAITHCLLCSNSFRPRSPLPNYLSWIGFVESIEDNLEVVSAVFVDHDGDSNLGEQILSCKKS